MIRVAVVGLGKMGLSHLSMIKAHPDVDVVGVCDASNYVLGVLGKYTGVATFTDYTTMLERTAPAAVIIATPSKSHESLVRQALERGMHVFCEKPFTLDPDDADALAAEARHRSLVTQVGYHYRFVGAFEEVKRLLEAGAIGTPTHALAEAYGPVVLKAKGGTWRSQKSEGGGALYDYAAHPVDLLTWYFGAPIAVSGTVMPTIFSTETEDAVFSTLTFEDGRTAQLSVDWSDESQRKMSTRITIWGTAGRIFADRQEVQVYRRDTAPPLDGYGPGWTVKYTTELTRPVWFYVRGEEYSAQLDTFVRRVIDQQTGGVNTFISGAVTDRALAMMVADAARPTSTKTAGLPSARRAGRHRDPRRLAVAGAAAAALIGTGAALARRLGGAAR